MLNIPQSIPSLTTDQMRQRLAGLVDPHEEKQEWYDQFAHRLSVGFCECLPMVFGQDLDRLTMWNKIASAIQSAYAKTVSGDTDLFVQHVMESIKADAANAVACEPLMDTIDAMHRMTDQQRQDWMQYLATHLIPVLAMARRNHKERLADK